MASLNTKSRGMTIAVWVLRIVVAAIFLLTAYMKLTSQPMMVADFETIGLGQWFRYLTGLLEVIGGLAVLIPSVSVFGAILLLCVTAGAFVTQAFVLHGDVIHAIVLGVIVLALIYLQRDQIKARLG